ncbi:ATP-binding cassette domain-containing protein [Candidatus Bathyarchaeota archaeon]|nr:ATP-binding cassette domain-containing protein [Candidatus Bathyarchaeota archaeon]
MWRVEKMVSPIIEIDGLSYTYPGAKKQSLSNVTLSIDKGDFVTLTGTSGCGKTTLCRCLNGLIPHFYGGEIKGDVVVSNLNVRDHAISELAQQVGFVFQNPENQLFALSVEREIVFGLENLALPPDEIRERLEWALKTIGIEALRERSPYEISGGQQQRVAIASVLAMKPEILILDEPTSSLDPQAAKNLFQVISKLNKTLGLTIILVEHRLDLLSTLTDRVIIMDGGSLRIEGNPREVFSSMSAKLMGIGIPKIVRLYQELESPPEKLLFSIEDFVGYLKRI